MMRVLIVLCVVFGLAASGAVFAAGRRPPKQPAIRYEKPRSPIHVELLAEPRGTDPPSWRILMKTRSPLPDSEALIELSLPDGMVLAEGDSPKTVRLLSDQSYVFEWVVESSDVQEGTLVGRVSLIGTTKSFERETYLKLGSSPDATKEAPYEILRTREGEKVMKY